MQEKNIKNCILTITKMKDTKYLELEDIVECLEKDKTNLTDKEVLEVNYLLHKVLNNGV